MSVMVEYTIEEAEALMKRLAPDGTISLSAAQCEAVNTGAAKLALAVQIERGPSGEHYDGSDDGSLEDLAQLLVGQEVRVSTAYGTTHHGRLLKIGGFRSLLISDGRFTHPVNLSLVTRLERERAAV